MNGEGILGGIIMTGCGLGCALTFFVIGIWAQRRKDPMHFYSGTTVDPKTVSDIPAYNMENAKMWKQFSIPFWLSGLLGIVSFFEPRLFGLSTVFLMVGSTFGIGWLVWKYSTIAKKYIIR